MVDLKGLPPKVPPASIPVPPGFRLERGLLWPADDKSCAAVVFGTAPDLEPAIAACRGRDLVIQAGGNCGTWPLYLADKFKAVYTFEPDPLNFTALAFNTATTPNVFRFQSALGTEAAWVDLVREEHNCGAHYIKRKGLIPTLTIDAFEFEECDLIVLDVEGYEMRALIGAQETIAAYRPVIVIEDKGLSEKFGVAKGTVEKWLAQYHGYRVIARPHRDVVLACEP
jgi:FkbM family methyltransferase